MSGRISVNAILSVKAGCDPLAAVRSLVDRAEGVKVIKWMEFPDSILVFLMIPGDLTSGAIYILERKSGVWYWIDFEDEQYGGYSQGELEQLLNECNLLSLVERSALLRIGLRWVMERGHFRQSHEFVLRECWILPRMQLGHEEQKSADCPAFFGLNSSNVPHLFPFAE